MTRINAVNHDGWVVQEFMFLNDPEKKEWVNITPPESKVLTETVCHWNKRNYPDREFRVYENLKEETK